MFSECVYKYFYCGIYTGVDISDAEIPDSTLRFVIQKVMYSCAESVVLVVIITLIRLRLLKQMKF